MRPAATEVQILAAAHFWADHKYTLVDIQNEMNLCCLTGKIATFIVKQVPEYVVQHGTYGGRGSPDWRVDRKTLFLHAFAVWWQANPDKRDAVSDIYEEIRLRMPLRMKTRFRCGHPDFNDPYGVWQVSTPRDVWLDDRHMLGKDLFE